MPLPNLDEPTSKDIEAAHRTSVRAAIGSNIGTPSPEVAAQIADVYGSAISPDRIFVFPAQVSNSQQDFYGTYMTETSLNNYARDAKLGRALMLAHNYMDLPIGQSFDARAEKDGPAGAAASGTTDTSATGRTVPPPPGPLDPILRLFEDFYMIRGIHPSSMIANDDVIVAVETRTYRDVSIGFNAGKMICNICHMDIWDWNCPHIPLVSYDVEGRLVLCLAAVEDGEQLETSFGYKGATPDAAVVPVKARLVAANGGLTKTEARTLSKLEYQFGQRLVDPQYLTRAWRTIVPLPGSNLHKEKEMTQRTNGRAVTAPRNTQRRDTTTGGGTGTGTGASGGTDAGAVEQVVSDEATATAQALADQIAAVNDQITAQQGVIDGINGQITGAQNAVDDQGNPIDNTELIAGLNQQLTAEQANMEALQAELQSLQAELDAVNGTADATGGTTTQAPAGTSAGASGANIAAAITQIRSISRRYLPYIRTLTTEEAQPLIDQLNQVLADLQNLVASTGANVARPSGDRVIFDVLGRSIEGGKITFSGVRQLAEDAKAGREYRKRLLDNAVKAQVRALGADKVDEVQYRRMLQGLDVTSLQAEVDRYEAVAGEVLTSGRHVIPGSMGDPAKRGKQDGGNNGGGSDNGNGSRTPQTPNLFVSANAAQKANEL